MLPSATRTSGSVTPPAGAAADSVAVSVAVAALAEPSVNVVCDDGTLNVAVSRSSSSMV